MPGWAGSDRRQRLPKDWPRIRNHVLKRDGRRCTERDPDTGRRCDELATEVDHIVPGDNHDPSNLRSLCEWHHRSKSSREGAQARNRIRAKNAQRFKRTEQHPGLI